MRGFILLVVAILAVGVSATATEWLVPRDFPTPAACIAAAAPGDSCILQPGTYAGGFVINKPNMKVISSNGALATTITGTVTIAADGVMLGRAGQGFLITDGVVITAPTSEGVTIEDDLITGSAANAGIWVDNTVGAVRDFSFLDVEIRSNAGGGIIFTNGGPVDDLVINGSAIEMNGGPGIGFGIGGSVRRFGLSNTQVTSNAVGGVVFLPPTGDLEDSEFSGATIQGNASFGLVFANTGRVIGVMISGNNISSHTVDNVAFGNGLVSDVHFENNTIENATVNGVNFSNIGAVEDTSFNNDTIQRNGQDGIIFSNQEYIDTVTITSARIRNNGSHNVFINHAPAINDYAIEHFTIEGGSIDQAGDNGVRIATTAADIDSVSFTDVQVSKNNGMGICLRTNSGSIGDVEFNRMTVKENQGGVGTPCDTSPAPIGSGAELITVTGNIGPVTVNGSSFTNNGGFGLRLDSLGPTAGDLGPVEVHSSEFAQNGTRAPAGLGSGLSLRGYNVHEITIDPTTASSNNDHGLDIQAANGISDVTISGGEFSNNDSNVDTVGAGINISATRTLTGLRVTGAQLNGNSQGARVQADRSSDNHINRCEITGNRRAGIEAALASGGNLDGTNNWWGDPSGPSGVGPGSGDAVTVNVDYDPWLTAPAVVTGANFQITGFDITPPAPDVGEAVTITVTVENTGSDEGTQDVVVQIRSGTTVLHEERQTVPLAAAGSTTITISYTFDAAGTYTIEAATDNDTETRTVTVGGGGAPPPPAPGGLVCQYAGADKKIDGADLIKAIQDYATGTLTGTQLIQVIQYYATDTECDQSLPGGSAAAALAAVPFSMESVGFADSQFVVEGVGIAAIDVRVYDLAGRVVFSGSAAGNTLAFSGLSSDGRPLANGIYLYTVKAYGLNGGVAQSSVQKLALLR